MLIRLGKHRDRSRIQKTSSCIRRGESAQTLIEFALAATVFLTIVFGIIEFGVLFNNQIHLSNAANDGARSGAIINGTDTQAIAVAATAAAGTISCPVATPTASRSGSSPTQQLTVNVQCSYRAITPLGLFLSGLNINFNLKGTSVMRVEQ